HAHRAAFIVTSLHHAADLLGAHAAGECAPSTDGCHTGTRTPNTRVEPLLMRTLAGLLAETPAIGSDDHDHCTALAHLYVSGYDTAERVHPVLSLPHLDLPGYPFARERYWPDTDIVAGRPGRPVVAMRPESEPATSEPVAEEPVVDSAAVRMDVALDVVTEQFAAVLKLDPSTVDVDERLEAYGLDSMLMMEVIYRLERKVGTLSRTLFFEHRTLRSVAESLVRTHADRLDQLAPKAKAKAVPAATAVRGEPSSPQVSQARPAVVAKPAQPVDRDPDLPIAVIGMAGRYPGADDLDAYWANLRDGVDCITQVPPDRWTWNHLDPDGTGGLPVWGGFLDGVAEFDPQFFRISPKEAAIIDPQERLFLQTAYAAIEDAGYTPQGLGTGQARVGVFVGVMYVEYPILAAERQLLGDRTAVSNTPASIANRVSWACDFTGPSIAIDTMCSSSLTAIHLACESIRRGESDAAVAGGVNVSIHPHKFVMLDQGKFASSSGRCESFGATGDGYVPSEGVGAVLLKPLADAVADGDHVAGVIRGSAVNHGGRSNGYTVPDPTAQGAVIGEALRRSGIDPAHIGYVEAHGTGTALGDPVEITGLGRVFGSVRDRPRLPIGSAKSVIGHAESAAGVAGLHKVLLQLRHRKLAPSLHSSDLNPMIDFDATPFVVQQRLADWPAAVAVDAVAREVTLPRAAAISSFGAGGANAHVVVEEYLGETTASVERPGPHPVVLSARSPEQLDTMLRGLADALTDDTSLDAVAFTLLTGRVAQPYRFGCLARDIAELGVKLRNAADGVVGDDCWRGEVRDPVPRHDGRLGDGGDDADLAATVAAWTVGAKVDWWSRYADGHPARVALPTYPFLRERHWPRAIDRAAVRATVTDGTGGRDRSGTWPHPLLEVCLPRLVGAEFASAAAGVGVGDRWPGDDALLEMARAAVALCHESLGGDAVVVLRDVVWGTAVGAGELRTSVLPALSGVEWEVYGRAADAPEGGADGTAHAQGVAELSADPLGRVDVGAFASGWSSPMGTGAASPVHIAPDSRSVLVQVENRDVPTGLVLVPGDLARALALAEAPLGLPTTTPVAAARAEFATTAPPVRHVVVGRTAAEPDGPLTITGCADDGSVVWRLVGLELDPCQEPDESVVDGRVPAGSVEE
uniref:beta-ketoacyl synthase N-terminal-like domain-containing protein n=1 Tax=Amycolatopsis anabasis TaxID=1840409 RepID=UPI001FEC7238